jgi:hypothetical protein
MEFLFCRLLTWLTENVFRPKKGWVHKINKKVKQKAYFIFMTWLLFLLYSKPTLFHLSDLSKPAFSVHEEFWRENAAGMLLQ